MGEPERTGDQTLKLLWTEVHIGIVVGRNNTRTQVSISIGSVWLHLIRTKKRSSLEFDTYCA